MGVQHAGNVGTRLVDRAVDHVARLVDVVIGIGLPEDIALDAYLHQARRGDFLVEQTVEIDQQMVGGAGNARGNVVVDEIGHVIFVDQPVAGREREPRLPFLRRDLVLDRFEIGRIVHRSLHPQPASCA